MILNGMVEKMTNYKGLMVYKKGIEDAIQLEYKSENTRLEVLKSLHKDLKKVYKQIDDLELITELR